MGIWLAVAMQVLSSFAFAGGAILQQLAVKSTFDPTARASSNQLTARGMLNLLRIPRWLLGLSLVFLGALIHLSALSFAPVTIVQPIGILAVPWAVIIAAKIHKHPLSGKLWAAVGVTIAGVAGFTLFSTTYATAEKFVTFPPMLISFAIVCVLAALRIVVVDVLRVGFQLGNLLVGNVQPLLLFRLRQRNPQLPPGAELVVLGEDELHLLAGIAGREWADIAVMRHNAFLRFHFKG